MTRFILHVGPHKTGTTYLQTNFLRHRAALRAKGIDYPEAWCLPEADHCHFGLFQDIKAGEVDAVAAVMRTLRDGACPTVLLSAEDLSILSEEELARLRQTIEGEVTVVYYIRRWADVIPSAVQENIRHGSTETLPEQLVQHMLHPLSSIQVNYALRLDRLARVFGEDAVRVVVYDNVVESGQDLFTHFVRQVLAGPADLAPEGGRVHGSLPVEEIELLRMGNVLRRLGEPVPANWVTFSLQAAERDTTALRAVMGRHIATLQINEMSEPFGAVYRDVLARYASRIVAGSRSANRSRLFRRIRKELPYVSPDYLAAPGAIQLIRDACGLA